MGFLLSGASKPREESCSLERSSDTLPRKLMSVNAP
jgi:hypothetical protein